VNQDLIIMVDNRLALFWKSRESNTKGKFLKLRQLDPGSKESNSEVGS
jgi:hypothetical protein